MLDRIAESDRGKNLLCHVRENQCGWLLRRAGCKEFSGFYATKQFRNEPIDRQAHLLRRVAITQRDCVVLHSLVIHGDAERRAGLVLAAVAPADRTRLIVKNGESLLEEITDR